MAKSSNNLIKYAGIAAILYFLFQKAGNFVSENFGVTKAKFKLSSFQAIPPTLKGKVVLGMANNTPIAVPFNSFFGDIKYGDIVLSNVNAFHGGLLAPNSVTNIDVSANIDLIALGKDAFKLYQSGELLKSLTLTGMAHVDNNLKVPVNMKLL
jgi:hypothetical protein